MTNNGFTRAATRTVTVALMFGACLAVRGALMGLDARMETRDNQRLSQLLRDRGVQHAYTLPFRMQIDIVGLVSN
jgi:hypothetical protein